MIAERIQAYFEQLTRYLEWQEERASEMERQLEQLRREVEALRERRTVHIERIDYKFDQLKIEKLEGALHIGISPDGAQSIEQFVTDGQAQEATEIMTAGALSDTDGHDGESSGVRSVRIAAAERVDRYLKRECPAYIRSAAARLGAALDDDYIAMMVQDIRRQVDDRLRHYERAGIVPDEPGVGMAELLASRVITDVRSAVERHVAAKRAGKSKTPAEGDEET